MFGKYKQLHKFRLQNSKIALTMDLGEFISDKDYLKSEISKKIMTFLMLLQ